MANYDAYVLRFSTLKNVSCTRASFGNARIATSVTYPMFISAIQPLTGSIFELTTTISGSGSTLTTYYQMRAVDPDCVLTLTYRSWIVTGSPDFTGAQYVGTRCGISPLTNIVVVDTWEA